MGVPVEFSTRAARDRDPVTGLRANGTWNQPAGTWSDDGALLLCTAEALACGGDEQTAGSFFVRWLREGHRAAGGVVFDVGCATRAALERIADGTPAASAGGAAEKDNGNGSLMRILPVALRFASCPPAELGAVAGRFSSITHRHPRSQLACVFYCLLVQRLMAGDSPQGGVERAGVEFRPLLARFPDEQARFARLQAPRFVDTPRADIRSGGYVMETLEAAVWCLLQGGTFAEIVLRAVNLGEDTDTTGCVAGGLAGVWQGLDAIPCAWRSELRESANVDEVVSLFGAAC